MLTWEIIFDIRNAMDPPDFIFDAEDYDFHPPLNEINSVESWDWTNKECLLLLVVELLDIYKDYQLKKAEQNESLRRHFTSLMKQHVHPLQVVVNRKAEKGLGTINVVGKLDVDLMRLPLYSKQVQQSMTSAVLHVCFPFPESSNIQYLLHLPPGVDKALGGKNNLRIPVFQPGTLLGEYFQQVKEHLETQVEVISEGLDKRKESIAALHIQFGSAVLEYDAKHFSKIDLLLEWNDFFFTVTIELPAKFPFECPIYTFKSVYHFDGHQPFQEKHYDIPWSPRWSCTEVAKRAKEYILGNIRSFQRASVNSADRPS